MSPDRAGIVAPPPLIYLGMLGLGLLLELFWPTELPNRPLAVSAGYGFSGIVVALFGKLHPLGAIPSSILFGGLLVGGDKMQRAVQVPQALIIAINGLVVVFVVSSQLWKRRIEQRLAEAERQEPEAELVGAATSGADPPEGDDP